MGISVSKEQYTQACSVDLYEFLVREHPTDVKQQYGSVLLLADQHVSVKRGYHGYRNFRTDETGNNIDYLMNFLGYDYQGAVLALINGSGVEAGYVPVFKHVIPKSKEIVLPKPLDGRYKNLYAFLLARKIPADVIQILVDKGILYQSAEGNNLVFVSPQGDYCELRGTNSFADRRCRRRTECERYCQVERGWCGRMDVCPDYKPDPFHGCKKTSPDRFWFFDPEPEKAAERIYICEAAIDAVSLYVIHKKQHMDGNKNVYVSIGGVANQRTINRIVRGRRDSSVILAVDNDEAGQECRDRNRNLDYILPRNKDWNDDLKKGDY